MDGRASASADWSDLQHFAAVARGGSIAAAAKALGVNHSTVLRRIGSLEATLGARLFDRLPTGYALTAAGNELAENLGGVAERIEAAQRRLAGLGEAIEGSIRIEVADIVVEPLLMPLLAAFRREHPAVRLQLAIAPGGAGIAPPEADLALRVGEAQVPRGPAVRVGALDAVLCASRRQLATAGARRPLTEQRWVVSDRAGVFSAFDRWRAQHVPDDRVAVRVDSLVGAADAIAGGLGIGLLPRPLAGARAGLAELDAPVAWRPEPLWILTHPDAQATARVERLAAFLAERLHADARLVH